jgi:hypothetical protein
MHRTTNTLVFSAEHGSELKCGWLWLAGSDVIKALIMVSILRYNAVQSGRVESFACCWVGYLLGLFFDDEDGGSTFPRNVG